MLLRASQSKRSGGKDFVQYPVIDNILTENSSLRALNERLLLEDVYRYLTPFQRQVVQMKYLGFKNREIAQKLVLRKIDIDRTLNEIYPKVKEILA